MLASDGQYLRVRFSGGEEAFPNLLDVTSFLYDINLLYELIRLSIDESHDKFRFSQYVLYRKGRPLKEVERLQVESLRLGSPIALSVVLPIVGGAIGAVGGLIAIFQTAQNASLNRRKLVAEVEKLERENKQNSRPTQIQSTEVEELERDNGKHSRMAMFREFENVETLRQILRIRESERLVDNIGHRLSKSPVRVKELEVEVVTSRTLKKGKSIGE